MNDFLEFFADSWEVSTETGCFLWTGCSDGRYGMVRYRGRTVSTHRASLVASKGLPPPGTCASHLCHTPLCINPAHLVWETQSRNLGRRDPERVKAVARLGMLARLKKARGYYVAKSGKYVAQVKIDGKSTHIGSFKTAAEAVEAYRNATKTERTTTPTSR